MKLDATLHLNKTTKGSIHYEESNWRNRPDYLIGTLYIHKAALEAKNIDVNDPPPTIKVTIEVE